MSSFYSSASSCVAGKPESKSKRNFPGKSEREREKKKKKEKQDTEENDWREERQAHQN